MPPPTLCSCLLAVPLDSASCSPAAAGPAGHHFAQLGLLVAWGMSAKPQTHLPITVVSALNKAWCVNCFSCSTCNSKLTLK